MLTTARRARRDHGERCWTWLFTLPRHLDWLRSSGHICDHSFQSNKEVVDEWVCVGRGARVLGRVCGVEGAVRGGGQATTQWSTKLNTLRQVCTVSLGVMECQVHTEKLCFSWSKPQRAMNRSVLQFVMRTWFLFLLVEFDEL